MTDEPTTGRPFLTATWSNLLLFTFQVPDAALAPHLPPGTEPDRLEGSALASIVAFDFLNTRVMGLGVPGFRNFPEWNLRIYVRHGEDRGVAFVREFVPNPLVAFIARAVYNEPYATARFTAERSEEGSAFSILHRIHAAGAWHSAGIRAEDSPRRPSISSLAERAPDLDCRSGRERRDPHEQTRRTR